jgi:hypothetical protein
LSIHLPTPLQCEMTGSVWAVPREPQPSWHGLTVGHIRNGAALFWDESSTSCATSKIKCHSAIHGRMIHLPLDNHTGYAYASIKAEAKKEKQVRFLSKLVTVIFLLVIF